MGNMMVWYYVFAVIIIEVALGIWLTFFTPEKGSRAGFKTKTTVSSDETWKFCNKKLGLTYFVSGLVEAVVFGLLLGLLLNLNLLAVGLPCILVVSIAAIVAPIIINTIALKKEN